MKTTKNKPIVCCNKIREGKFCNECGRSLLPKDEKLRRQLDKTKKQLKTAKNRIHTLEAGVYHYVEAHHKKMAGSTIQYSIKDLEKLLPESWVS
jgi:hypothetical protein